MDQPTDISQLLKRMIFDDPELRDLIDARVEAKNLEKEYPSCYTREQLAKVWQISVKSLDRMDNDEIRKNGFIRKKIGVSVRFERIAPTFREMYDKIKGNK